MTSSLRHMPVRWRLAVTSAALTLAILVAFAFAVGRLSADRLRTNFSNEVSDTATDLANQVEVSGGLGLGRTMGLRLGDFAMPNHAQIRIVDAEGRVLAQTSRAGDLGPPRAGVSRMRAYHVATTLVRASARLGGPPVYLQYARSTEDIEGTIDRLWLFLALGVLGATGLSLVAGLAVAGRAMRPVAALTETARAVAITRDPSRRIPEPSAHDEIGELASTLEQMLRALDEARAETQRALGRQREFVADASHELRTPLTSVLANLEMLEQALSGGEQREMVDSALRSSRRMRRLVADLLLLARADAERPGHREECDLSRVAADVAHEIGPLAEGRAIELDLAGELPVQANPDELHRMAVNLVENAVRHTPTTTRVTVATRREAERAVLEVRDDGPGLEPAIRERLFDRFVRGNGAAGTGLGLAIVRAVVESHQGQVETGEGPEGGARFVVRLPLAGSPVAGRGR